MTDQQQLDVRPFERHAQTVIQVILVAVLIWAGQQLIQTSHRVVSLEVKVQALEVSMTGNMDDRYRARDAQRDFDALRREMAESNRIHDLYHSRVEERLKKLEGR
jgi:hypothetical protein